MVNEIQNTDSPTEAVCVHMHLFKNAGSTVDWALKRNFGSSFSKFDDVTRPANVYTAEDLRAHLESHPGTRAVSSHQLRFPLPEINLRRLIPIVLLRQPVDRAFSVYRFEKRQPEKTPGSTMASRLSMRQYMEWRMTGQSAAVIRNFQVQFLSWCPGITSEDNRACENNLDEAAKRLAECTVMGVVERMAESLALGELLLRPWFGNLDLSYVSQNVTPDRASSIEERISLGRAEIGDDVFEKICRNNKLDNRLHEFANMELNRRIAANPRFEEHFAEFKNRCRAHETAGADTRH